MWLRGASAYARQRTQINNVRFKTTIYRYYIPLPRRWRVVTAPSGGKQARKQQCVEVTFDHTNEQRPTRYASICIWFYGIFCLFAFRFHFPHTSLVIIWCLLFFRLPQTVRAFAQCTSHLKTRFIFARTYFTVEFNLLFSDVKVSTRIIVTNLRVLSGGGLRRVIAAVAPQPNAKKCVKLRCRSLDSKLWNFFFRGSFPR